MTSTLPLEDRLPQRVQRQRTKGWRMPPSSVYVGRPTFYGNPYLITQPPPLWDPRVAEKMGMPATWGRLAAVKCFEYMLASGWRLKRPPGFQIVERAQVELEGKDLVCWCPLDEPCHADILLAYANEGIELPEL